MTYNTLPPAVDPKTGYVPRTGVAWNGHKWGMNNGLTWNHNTPYALGMGTDTDYLRFELHDTPYDHGQNDPSTKRRCEIGSADTFKNGVEYWFAYDFRTHVTNLKAGLSVRTMQIHWPSGASPAVGHSLKYHNGGLQFVVSTKNDTTDNVTRGTADLLADVAHHVVMNFKLGCADSFEKTYVDGKLVSSFVGPVGSLKENGYSLRLGNYGVITGMQVVTEYKNLAKFPSSDNLSALISTPASI